MLSSVAAGAEGNCWSAAAKRYRVSAQLLIAIARHESGLNALAVNVNKNGTYDLGLMQINTSWLGKLAKYGIYKRHLFNPCTNVMVGAWILRKEMNKYGNTWKAVGAYNTGSYTKSNKAYKIRMMKHYAWQIYKNLNYYTDK